MQGSFALVKINDDEGRNWLLIKKKDEHHVSPYNIEKIPPIKKAGKSKWKPKGSSEATEEPKTRKSRSDDIDAPGPRSKKEETIVTGKHSLTKRGPLCSNLLAVLAPEITNDPECIYEPKYDGYRSIAKINNGKVEMLSRNAKSFNDVYEPIVKNFKN